MVMDIFFVVNGVVFDFNGNVLIIGKVNDLVVVCCVEEVVVVLKVE